jgi:hypothetical protein
MLLNAISVAASSVPLWRQGLGAVGFSKPNLLVFGINNPTLEGFGARLSQGFKPISELLLLSSNLENTRSTPSKGGIIHPKHQERTATFIRRSEPNHLLRFFGIQKGSPELLTLLDAACPNPVILAAFVMGPTT